MNVTKGMPFAILQPGNMKTRKPIEADTKSFTRTSKLQ